MIEKLVVRLKPLVRLPKSFIVRKVSDLVLSFWDGRVLDIHPTVSVTG